MNIKAIISRSIVSRFGLSNILSVRSCATAEKPVQLKQETKSGELVYDEVPVFDKSEDEDKINQLRNKSRLNPSDLNILHNRKPYEKNEAWYHETVKYKRRILGRYGLKALDATPGIAWPTKEEVEDAKEYEKVFNPLSLQEGWKLLEERKRAEEEELRIREQEIDEKLENMHKWRAELQKKIDQKEATERAAILKREKMMEEIRQHFGMNLNPKSPKVQEMLLKKEEEAKKLKKALKKEEKAAKALKYMNEQLKLLDEDAKSAEGTKTEAASKDNETKNKDEKKDPKLEETNKN